VSLHRINRRSAALQQAISMAHVKQLTDLGRLVGALAHEIRNPLNAIRLNLHALRNVLLGTARLSDDEIEQVVEESNREIERLSALMKTMLGYARPDQAVVEDVELNAELDAIAGFLAPVMERDGVDLVVTLPDVPISVAIDPDRLRQILLNLLNNAREAAGAGGRVTLTLTATDDQAEVTVADNGPGVPTADRDRIFDAFYSTRETGTGLGLALVKRFVEEAGGSVGCEDRRAAGHYSGAVFRVVFPIVPATSATQDESTRAEMAGVAGE
jgi:signal transduction histidine kinase